MSITRRGAGTYLVRVYLGLDPLTGGRLEINETVRGTEADARKVEAKINGQKESGRITKTPRMTVDALFDHYVESARHCQTVTTQNKDRTFLNKYARPYIGTTPLRKVTSKLLQDLFNLLMDEKEAGGRGLGPGTVRTLRKVLAAAFNYAVRQKIIAESPVSGTRVPSVEESKAAPLTFEDAEAFESVKDDLWYGHALVFQLYTGLRPQELMALIWEDVDFERGILRVERASIWKNGIFTSFGPPKNRRGKRTFKLTTAALDLLRHHHKKQVETTGVCKMRGEHYGEAKIKEWAESKRPRHAKLYASAELIFPRPDGRVPNSGAPRQEFKEALRRAKILTDYRWYDLRHTNASFLIKLGVALTDVAARMGHSLAELVRTYAHQIEDERSDAPNWFAKLVPV
jgi:integrase